MRWNSSILIRNHIDITGIFIKEKEYRLSQYVDDRVLFLGGLEKSALDPLYQFPKYSGLKPNIEKQKKNKKTKALCIGSKCNCEEKNCLEYNLDWLNG